MERTNFIPLFFFRINSWMLMNKCWLFPKIITFYILHPKLCDLLSCKEFLLCALNWTGVLMATAVNCHIPQISFSKKLASIILHYPKNESSGCGWGDKSLQPKIPPQENPSRKIPPQKNSSQQNPS